MKTTCLFVVLVLYVIGDSGETGSGDIYAFESNVSMRYPHEDKLYTCSPLERTCSIQIPNKYEPINCRVQRKKEIQSNRKFYKLTIDGEKQVIKFPLKSIPFLNQTMDAVQYHTALDPVDSRWLILIKTFKAIINQKLKEAEKAQHIPRFDQLNQYEQIYHQHNEQIKKMSAPKYFSNPTMEQTFTNPFGHDNTFSWTSDNIFTQQRLAGTCPFLIKLVTIDGHVGMHWGTLKKQLNPSYDFLLAINNALGYNVYGTLNEVVEEGVLYVLYHEEYNDMKTQPDFYKSRHPDGPSLESVTSPITLFVRAATGVLKVSAIQWDYKPDSEVFSPESDYIRWSIAKSMVNLVDSNYCHGVWHLSHVHFSSHVYCTIFRSHFSVHHPIHQIMRYHCEGTVPHVTLAWPTLATPGMEAHRLSSIGHIGFAKLATIGYRKYYYGKLAYDNILKAHGLNSKEITYHPFRDDGILLWDEFQAFAKKFVDMFYWSDYTVRNDHELQSYANEISIDGKTAPYGGRGKVIGFPSSFRTRNEVEMFITRFIWLTAIHSAVNYAVEPWSTFIPLSPMKMYHDKRTYKERNMAYAYPDAPSTMGATVFTMLLGNLRVNRIMDHYDKVRHIRLSKLIRYHHHKLHVCVQKELEKRNARRKGQKQMGFQYFEPKWLTNSVHV